ncbi:MAG: hypothetical protein GY716_00995 [bacterium]|nr:hypothetical protein [bacterium]
MSHAFGTPGWAAALRAEIEGSAEYRRAGAKWGVGFNGNILLAFEADPGLGCPVYLLLRLAAGSCADAAFVDDGRHPEAGFTLRAPFSLWREVLERRLPAPAAIMSGRVAVEGDKMRLLRHTAAARAMLDCAASIDTDW